MKGIHHVILTALVSYGKKQLRASDGRGFSPAVRRPQSNLLKLLGAICGGAEAPPFQRASQQFFHSPLAASVLLAAVEPLPAQTQGAWAATGSMNVARELAASATLANARILSQGARISRQYSCRPRF